MGLLFRNFLHVQSRTQKVMFTFNLYLVPSLSPSLFPEQLFFSFSDLVKWSLGIMLYIVI